MEVLDKSKEYRVYFSDKKKNRSLNLNAYYWGVVLKILEEHTGYYDNELHKMCKREYLLRTRFNNKGEVEEYIESTTVLNNQEFIKYIDKIIVWGSTFFGCYFPEPNEIEEETYIKYIDR